MMKKVLILALVFLLIFLIVVALIPLIRNQVSVKGGWKSFDNTQLDYRFTYPGNLELQPESDGALYISGESLAMEFQSYYSFPLKKGQSIENFLDTEPSPAKSMLTQKVQVGKNVGYLQKALPGGGELDSVTYLKVHNSRKNQYLAVAIIKGNFDEALPVLETLEFY